MSLSAYATPIEIRSAMQSILSHQIDELISALLLPLSEEQKADGWTEQSKNAAIDMFSAIKRSVQHGRALPALDIANGLNHWGVVCGSIFDNAKLVSESLHKFKENRV